MGVAQGVAYEKVSHTGLNAFLPFSLQMMSLVGMTTLCTSFERRRGLSPIYHGAVGTPAPRESGPYHHTDYWDNSWSPDLDGIYLTPDHFLITSETPISVFSMRMQEDGPHSKNVTSEAIEKYLLCI